ncbi:MAG: acetyl-CoA carboxylase biotin carboxyl carrier protein [Flavobacteriales bacterium]
MDINEIQSLIKFVAKSGASEVSLEMKDFKITIKTPPKKRKGQAEEQETPIIQPQIPLVGIPTGQAIQQAPQENPPVGTSDEQVEKVEKEETKDSNYITVKSPMIGTFYRSPAPDKPPFVSVGDNIEVGHVLCVIEAMKLFNEIESEINGKIIKVLVDDATPVEYDQPLFLVEPL